MTPVPSVSSVPAIPTTSLAQALLPPDGEGPIFRGTVRQVYANGTVDVDLGGGQLAKSCECGLSFTPTSGQQVRLMRQSPSLWWVLDGLRTSAPTTVTVGNQWVIPFNVTAATPGVANPYVVSAVSTHSWRDADGWAGSIGDTVGQGAYSTTNGYYRGCYFYGSGAFSALAGRRCTRAQIKLVRTGAGGDSAATQQILAPHAHPSQPADSPYFVPSFGTSNVGSLAWSASGTFDMPVSWGQALIDGTAVGIGHLLLAAGNGNYSLNAGKTADTTTGQISLTWS